MGLWGGTGQDLVGRAEELALLDVAITDAKEGHGGLVVLHGEPGIGKTTLAQAFAARATERGLLLCCGRAWETGGAPPFWPWIEVLRELVTAAPPGAITGTPGLAALVDLAPELAAHLPDAPALPPLAPPEARFRVFDATADLLRRVARGRPVAVVLDDLHAADLPTIELARFCGRAARSVAVAIVVAMRDAEARLAPDTREALAGLTREGQAVALARLSRADVAELAGRTGSRPPDALVDRLVRTSEGNPLFVVEALRLLRASPAASLGELALAEGARAVVRERLRLLPAETRWLLEVAAAQGRTFDVAVLAQAVKAPLQVLHEALGPAMQADVVARTGSERAEFTHVLLRDELYEALPAARRAQIHLDTAEALELRAPADERTRVMGLAHHFLEAGTLGLARAMPWVQLAAERAVELHAHEEAVALLGRALVVLDAAGDAGTRRADVLLALGQALMRAGETTRGRQTCRRAAEIARALADGPRLARAALVYGEQFTFAVVDPILVALLEEALAAIGHGDASLRARLLARLAAALQPDRDPRRPMELAREAIQLVQGNGDAVTRLGVLTAAGSALVYFAEPAERIEVNQQIVEIGLVVGDEVRVARGHLRLVFDFLEKGDVAAANGHIAAHAAIAERLGLPVLLWNARMLRAMRCTFDGQFEDAGRLAEEAAALSAHTDDPNTRLTLSQQRVGRLVTATRWDELAEAERPFREILAAIADPGYARPCFAALAAHLGRRDEARAALDEAASHLEEWRARPCAVWLAEACAFVGDQELAPRLAEILAPFAHRNHLWGIASMVAEGPITEAIGLLDGVMGHWNDAVRHLEDARHRCAAMGARPLLARVEARLARALRARNAGEDEERATALEASARAAARALGMPGLLASLPNEGNGEPGRAAVAIEPNVPATTPLSLALEGEIWTLRWGQRQTRLKDSRGLRILARLVESPGREFHVFDLLRSGEDAPDRGDAGEALDGDAIAEYRARVHELREAIDEAEELGRKDRAERMREEMDAIAAELSRGLGLGGRARRVASGAERARVNVRRRLVDAIQKISTELPELGHHLGAAVKTGVFCSYRPEGRPFSASPRGRGTEPQL